MTLVKRIVEGYEQNDYPLRDSNISMDQYYTSIPLAKWLYSKHITCIGTIQTNQKGLPKEIKGREKSSWIACKEEGGNFHRNSYIVKTKSTGMRNAFLLHAIEAAHYVTNDEKKESYTYKIHDFTKRGIDLPDQRMGLTLVTLAYVLNMSRNNSQAIYVMKQGIQYKSV